MATAVIVGERGPQVLEKVVWQSNNDDLGFWEMCFTWVLCWTGICYKGSRLEWAV